MTCTLEQYARGSGRLVKRGQTAAAEVPAVPMFPQAQKAYHTLANSKLTIGRVNAPNVELTEEETRSLFRYLDSLQGIE